MVGWDDSENSVFRDPSSVGVTSAEAVVSSEEKQLMTFFLGSSTGDAILLAMTPVLRM
jgi:hypothetical protein